MEKSRISVRFLDCEEGFLLSPHISAESIAKHFPSLRGSQNLAKPFSTLKQRQKNRIGEYEEEHEFYTELSPKCFPLFHGYLVCMSRMNSQEYKYKSDIVTYAMQRMSHLPFLTTPSYFMDFITLLAYNCTATPLLLTAMEEARLNFNDENWLRVQPIWFDAEDTRWFNKEIIAQWLGRMANWFPDQVQKYYHQLSIDTMLWSLPKIGEACELLMQDVEVQRGHLSIINRKMRSSVVHAKFSMKLSPDLSVDEFTSWLSGFPNLQIISFDTVDKDRDKTALLMSKLDLTKIKCVSCPGYVIWLKEHSVSPRPQTVAEHNAQDLGPVGLKTFNLYGVTNGRLDPELFVKKTVCGDQNYQFDPTI